MDAKSESFWPWDLRLALLLAPAILFGGLILLALVRGVLSWPDPDLSRWLAMALMLAAVLPLALAVLDRVARARGVVEVRGVKLDFTAAAAAATPTPRVETNIGVPGQPVGDSDTEQILDALERAVSSPAVVIDLEDGTQWWETRLLVLLAGAVRLGSPRAVVFVAREGGVPGRFAGWAPPEELLPLLLRADDRYAEAYDEASTTARRWELVESIGGGLPALPAWIGGPAQAHLDMAFDPTTGLRRPFAAEQLLAALLGQTVEHAARPEGIRLSRLEELFRPALRRRAIDERGEEARWIDELLATTDEHVAVVRDGVYLRLVPRLEGLTAIVRGLATKR